MGPHDSVSYFRSAILLGLIAFVSLACLSYLPPKIDNSLSYLSGQVPDAEYRVTVAIDFHTPVSINDHEPYSVYREIHDSVLSLPQILGSLSYNSDVDAALHPDKAEIAISNSAHLETFFPPIQSRSRTILLQYFAYDPAQTHHLISNLTELAEGIVSSHYSDTPQVPDIYVVSDGLSTQIMESVFRIDMVWVIPLGAALTLLVCLLLIRPISFIASLFVFNVVVCAATTALYTAMGLPLSLFSATSYSIIITMCTANFLHSVSLSKSSEHRHSAISWRPFLLSNITSLLGFILAWVFSQNAVADAHLLGSIGACVTLVLSTIAVPAAASLFAPIYRFRPFSGPLLSAIERAQEVRWSWVSVIAIPVLLAAQYNLKYRDDPSQWLSSRSTPGNALEHLSHDIPYWYQLTVLSDVNEHALLEAVETALLPDRTWFALYPFQTEQLRRLGVDSCSTIETFFSAANHPHDPNTPINEILGIYGSALESSNLRIYEILTALPDSHLSDEGRRFVETVASDILALGSLSHQAHFVTNLAQELTRLSGCMFCDDGDYPVFWSLSRWEQSGLIDQLEVIGAEMEAAALKLRGEALQGLIPALFATPYVRQSGPRYSIVAYCDLDITPNSREGYVIAEEVLRFAQEEQSDTLKFDGWPMDSQRLSETLFYNSISLTAMLLLLLVSISFAFRSIMIGIAVTSVAVLPISVFLGGVLVLSGRASFSTLTGLVIIAGLVVDNAIYFSSRLREKAKQRADSIEQFYSASFSSTVVLVASLLPLLLSLFWVVAERSIIAILLAIASLLACWVFLPGVFALFQDFANRGLLRKATFILLKWVIIFALIAVALCGLLLFLLLLMFDFP